MTTETSQSAFRSSPAPIAELTRIDDALALNTAVQSTPSRPLSVHFPPTGVSLKELTDGLRKALLARETIGVAQGMLMQRCGLTKNQAYEVLQRYGQEHGVAVRVLAERFLRSGRITINVDDLVAAVTQPPSGGNATF